MSYSNSSSLFHFTKNLRTLMSIIKNGLRFSYAIEKIPAGSFKDYPTNGDKPEFKYNEVAIPMVSFCDIPLMRISQHSKKYGKYVIGLDKSFITYIYSKIINPVIYVNSENLWYSIGHIIGVSAKSLEKDLLSLLNINNIALIQKGETKDKLLSLFEPSINHRFSSNFITGLTKPHIDIENNKICYYDEREWRAFWPANLEETDWAYNVPQSQYQQERKAYIRDLNKHIAKSSNGYITLIDNYLNYAINHIIIKDEKEREKIIDFILNTRTIFGISTISYEERLNLISKITSFEMINKDY